MRRIFKGLAGAAIVGLVISLATAAPSVTHVDHPKSGLRTWEVGAGALPLVLLHGYGSAPREFLPFTDTIRASSRRRFIFPDAPESTRPPDGPLEGRAWWRLDLASYVPAGQSLPDLSHARPLGLVRAASRVHTLLAEIDARLGSSPDRLILGGFSQGAMVASEIALRSPRPMRALVLLSPTFVDEAAWTAAMPARRGLPVFIAHGRRDDILSFAAAERLGQAMRQAGLRVTWAPFDAGHDIPKEVVDALNTFLASIGDD